MSTILIQAIDRANKSDKVSVYNRGVSGSDIVVNLIESGDTIIEVVEMMVRAGNGTLRWLFMGGKITNIDTNEVFLRTVKQTVIEIDKLIEVG